MKFDIWLFASITSIVLLFLVMVTLIIVLYQYTDFSSYTVTNQYKLQKLPYNKIHKKTWKEVLNSPCYIINMDRSRKRFDLVSNRVKEQGYSDVRRFAAVDGRNDNLEDLYKNYKFTLREDFKERLGEQGCLLSWLQMLRTIIEEDDEIVTVFEDDVVFDIHFRSLAPVYYNYTPDNFDMIYMGFLSYLVPFHTKIVSIPCFCFHALIFTREGAQKMYDWIINQPFVYTIDGMVYDYQWRNEIPWNYYGWNLKRPQYWLKGFKGLCYQDKSVPSTINTSED